MTTANIFLFVSHVTEDRSAAMEIVGELERRGVPCWVAPRNVRPGKPFDDEIAEAIDASRAMLLIFSERCNDSEYIRREITVAGEAGKIIIPLRIENAQPRKGLRVRLSDLHWIDAFVSRERAIDELVGVFYPTGDETVLKPGATRSPRDDGRRINKLPGAEQPGPIPAASTSLSSVNTTAEALIRKTDGVELKARKRQLFLVTCLAVTTSLIVALFWIAQSGLLSTSSNVRPASSFTTFESVPLSQFAKILGDDIASVAAKGASGSSIFVPRSGTLELDYEVESGKKIMITLLTGEQYQQLSSGQKATGQPPLKVIVEGTGKESVNLDRGNYFLAFNNRHDTNARIHYRTSFIEPLDTIKIDSAGKILGQATISVLPRAADAAFGLQGVDISAPGRGWLQIDFSISQERELVLLVVDRQQKDQLLAGRDSITNPKARVIIKGPETASHEIVVDREDYFVAFLNYSASPAKLIYRTSFRSF